MVEGIFGHPARVALLDEQVTERLLATIRGRGHDVPEDIFIFPAVASTDRLDSYFTRMHESSLRNYAQDMNTGIAFQNSHKHGELPFGRSIEGEFDLAALSAMGYFYTLRGLNLNGVNTDDLIRGIQSGIVSDVSIGFYGGDYVCSECDRSLFDPECTHIPGLRYDDRVGFAWVKDSHMAELSAVYEGATPGAAIIKAQREADAGRLRPEAAQIIEQRYRIKLPGAHHVWAVAEKTKEEGVDGIREVVAEYVPAAADMDELEGVRALADQLATATGDLKAVREELVAVRAKVAELEPLANDGRVYRADLVTEALVEGVRAHGDAFAKETYEGLLAQAPIAVVKRMRDDWRAVADKIFVAGRQSEDKGAEQKLAAPAVTVPATAYKG